MKNFKEIADKCLAGELSGTFKLASGELVSSNNLKKDSTTPRCIYQYQMYVDKKLLYYTIYGTLFSHRKESLDIIDFIPDNMQKKIEIDIPEGKVPVIEQTEKGVVITWEKELTYNDILNHLWEQKVQIGLLTPLVENKNTDKFNKKVDVLCKLTNIRNYFGKPTDGKGYGIFYHEYYKKFYVDVLGPFSPVHVCFSTKEQAEQAIKMVGDELKYLFEPW